MKRQRTEEVKAEEEQQQTSTTTVGIRLVHSGLKVTAYLSIMTIAPFSLLTALDSLATRCIMEQPQVHRLNIGEKSHDGLNTD